MATTMAGGILGMKARIAINSLRSLKRHAWVNMTMGTALVLSLLGGGVAFFGLIFNYLMNLKVFGPPLMDLLIGLVFLVFFAMLCFSNLIITLSTSYIAKEVDFLMGQPISHASIFRQKLMESVLYSSWAFVLLSIPLFWSYGTSRHVSPVIFPLLLVLIIPFVTIPAAFGSMVTMFLTAFFPARRTRLMVAILAGLALLGSLGMAHFLGLGKLLSSERDQDFIEIMGNLKAGSSPLLPSAWLARGLFALGPSDLSAPNYRDYGYWLAMLAATALFLLEVNNWLAPRLYYKGWCLSRDRATVEEESNSRRSFFVTVDRWLEILPAQSRALIGKDLKVFWRDPAQWTQLVILMGLLLIYLFNLGSAHGYSRIFEYMPGPFRTMLALFNMAATCFLLSILTTRCVYPMLSLEGRGFWTVGLAPMRSTYIVWQKCWLTLASTASISLVVIFLSNIVLQVDYKLRLLSVVTVVIMSAGLTSLSVGLGALLPNFKEDNPARIANGVGGMFNIMLSLAYIGLTIGMLVLPKYLELPGHEVAQALWFTWRVPYGILLVLVQVVTICLPMYLGLRKWRSLEM